MYPKFGSRMLHDQSYVALSAQILDREVNVQSLFRHCKPAAALKRVAFTTEAMHLVIRSPGVVCSMHEYGEWRAQVRLHSFSQKWAEENKFYLWNHHLAVVALGVTLCAKTICGMWKTTGVIRPAL